MVKLTRFVRVEWCPLLTVLMALVLTSQPAISQAARNDLNTPVYSDPSIVVPESLAGAEAESGSASFEGTGVMTLAKETVENFEALLTLPPATAPEGVETIIGSDTRQRLYTAYYPTRAVALITFDAGRCSGNLIGPDLVFTAGHCVHTGGTGGNWQTRVTVYPGYDGVSGAVWGSCGAAWLASVTGWTVDGDERYDYGVVKLNCNVGNTVGWFGFWWQVASLLNTPTTISGYPGDKPLEQWVSVDKVRVNQALQIFYENDSIGGMSGSGVWQDRRPGSPFCSGPCIMAVHAYGFHNGAPHSTNNHGERITKDRFTNLINWKNAPK